MISDIQERRRRLREVTGEAGLYIKELISGDKGRQRSLTEVLNTPARVIRRNSRGRDRVILMALHNGPRDAIS